MRMIIVLLSALMISTNINAQTCPATSQTTGSPFLRVAVAPNLFSCVYQDGSNFQTNYTPGPLSGGPWHGQGWSAWCGSPDHTDTTRCIF